MRKHGDLEKRTKVSVSQVDLTWLKRGRRKIKGRRMWGGHGSFSLYQKEDIKKIGSEYILLMLLVETKQNKRVELM